MMFIRERKVGFIENTAMRHRRSVTSARVGAKKCGANSEADKLPQPLGAVDVMRRKLEADRLPQQLGAVDI